MCRRVGALAANTDSGGSTAPSNQPSPSSRVKPPQWEVLRDVKTIRKTKLGLNCESDAQRGRVWSNSFFWNRIQRIRPLEKTLSELQLMGGSTYVPGKLHLSEVTVTQARLYFSHVWSKFGNKRVHRTGPSPAKRGVDSNYFNPHPVKHRKVLRPLLGMILLAMPNCC